MSHFTEMKVNFDCSQEAALIAGLEKVFGKGHVEVHEDGAALVGYQGDNRAKLEQSNASYAPPCHLIVRRQHVGGASNDVGYRRTEEGQYVAYISDYDKGANFNVNKQNEVKQVYTTEVTTKVLKERGYIAKAVKQPDGSVKIVGSKLVK